MDDRRVSRAVLPMRDAEVILYHDFFSEMESREFLQALLTTIPWEQKSLRMFGKPVLEPRMTAWYGDENAIYAYSGISRQPLPWTPELQEIRGRIQEVCSAEFNSVLLNRYRNGDDSIGWHSDDERELGTNPVIASVSFGATRRFQFKHRQKPDLRQNLDLTHGSLLLMQGATQHHWVHQVPKTARPAGARINLTFRVIRKPEER